MARKKELENSFQSNPLLKRIGVDIEFDEDNVNEFMKCKKDINYFANNYIKIVTLDKGLTNIKLYKYQEKLLKTFDRNRFVVVKYPFLSPIAA
jgi:hypothetical protein